MYSKKAEILRRCQAMTQRGAPCRQWAVWGDSYCVQHGGHRTRRGGKTNYEPCTCVAYAWPHRPGGGFCRWPESPRWRLNMRAGTHVGPRSLRGLMQRYSQSLMQDQASEAVYFRKHQESCAGDCHYCRSMLAKRQRSDFQ